MKLFQLYPKALAHLACKSPSREVFPRRRFSVETLRAPSLPLVTSPLGFPRYRVLKGSLEAWRFGSFGGALPHTPTFFKARNGGRRSRSAAKPQSDRWSPKRLAPHLASSRFLFSPYYASIPHPQGTPESPVPPASPVQSLRFPANS